MNYLMIPNLIKLNKKNKPHGCHFERSEKSLESADSE